MENHESSLMYDMLGATRNNPIAEAIRADERSRVRREFAAWFWSKATQDERAEDFMAALDRICPAGPEEAPPAPAPPAPEGQEIRVELDRLEMIDVPPSPSWDRPNGLLRVAASKAGCRPEDCRRVDFDPMRMVYTFTFLREAPREG